MNKVDSAINEKNVKKDEQLNKKTKTQDYIHKFSAIEDLFIAIDDYDFEN